MIKYLKYICLALIGLPLFLLALANNHTVNLYLFPESIAAFLGLDAFISMPLFIALLLGGLIGLLVGFIWQGLRGVSARLHARLQQRELTRMKREADRLNQSETGASPKDDILALIE